MTLSPLHDLSHAINGCACRMQAIVNCVVCERRLEPDRDHVDTCSEGCFRKLLQLQRESP